VALINGAVLSQRLAATEPTTVQFLGLARRGPPRATGLRLHPDRPLGALRRPYRRPAGEHPATELLAAAARSGLAHRSARLHAVGLEVGFNLAQIAPLLSPPEETEVRPQNPALLAAEQNRGAHVRPVCWTRFDAGDALSIAVHEVPARDPIPALRRASALPAHALQRPRTRPRPE
jgi:hypothetical protein